MTTTDNIRHLPVKLRSVPKPKSTRDHETDEAVAQTISWETIRQSAWAMAHQLGREQISEKLFELADEIRSGR